MRHPVRHAIGLLRHLGRTALMLAALAALIAVPSEARIAAATLITVKTNSDESNGTLSSVAGLLADPGPDGISLREALRATNNDPGQYTIRFAPALAGTTIRVGAAPPGFPSSELPPLTGGGVSVDGDIDGDGRPDVSLARDLPANVSRCGACAFTIASSGNHLHALTLEGFTSGVFFGPIAADGITLLTSQTYASNVVSSLVMKDVSNAGIMLSPTPACALPGPACATHDTWTDLQLTDNEIESRDGGITIDFFAAAANRVERLTIARNTIRIDEPSGSARYAVNLSIGGWIDSRENVLSDALIADNTIGGNPLYGIRLSSGDVGASANTVEKVRITGNKVHITPVEGVVHNPWAAISIGAGDAASDYLLPELRPIVYADDNIVRNVEVSGNTLAQGTGVFVAAACCGAARNAIQDVRIANNEMRTAGPFAAVWVAAQSSAFRFGRATTENRVSGLSIDANRMTMNPGTPRIPPVFVGAVVVQGGLTATAGRVTDVGITNNRIDNAENGISLIGGVGNSPEQDVGPLSEVTDNEVAGALVRGNVISGYHRAGVLAAAGSVSERGRPTLRNAIRGLTIEHNELTTEAGRPGTSGVELIGGDGSLNGGSVSDNRVEDVSVSGNTIRGNTAGIRLVGGIGPTTTRNSVNVVVGQNELEGNVEPVRLTENHFGGLGNVIEAVLPRPEVGYAGVATTRTTARVKAIVDPQGSDTRYFVRYGRSRAYGRSTARRTARAAAGRRTISERIGRLRPGTTYHYDVIARSRGGETVGRDATFRTKRRRG